MPESPHSHVFATFPFVARDGADFFGRDPECEAKVEAWTKRHARDYTLDAPRLIAEGGRFLMYCSGTHKEHVKIQSKVGLEIQVFQAQEAAALQESLQPRVAGVIPSGAIPRGTAPRLAR